MATNVQTGSPPVSNAKKSGLLDQVIRNRSAYLYLIPAFAIMGLVTFYPLFYQLWMSFHDFQRIHLNPANIPDFIGFNNYLRILGLNGGLPQISNFNFARTLGFNLWWTFSNVIFHVSIGIIIAVILNQPGIRGRSIYRAIYILPMVIPALVIATVWRNMFDVEFGPINQSLQAIGAFFGVANPEEVFRIRWLDDPNDPISFIPLPWSYFAMLITNIWLGWPFMTIVATGALQSIPKDLYEAASIDGASGLQQFRSITLPLLRPAMIPAAMFGMITTFNLFHVIYFMSGGAPFKRTEILVTWAYRLVNENGLYGVAAAFAVYIFFILLALTLLTNTVTRATESYDA